MRYMFCIAVMLLLSFAMSAQQPTYVITKLADTDQALLETALEKCSLDRYRKLEGRSELHFKSGTIVQLLSFKELEAQGIKLDASHAVPEEHTNNNTFVLSPQGYVLEQIEPVKSLQNEKVRSEKK